MLCARDTTYLCLVTQLPGYLPALPAKFPTRIGWYLACILVYFQSEPEHGGERLLSQEEWKQILEPFEVEKLRHCGEAGERGREPRLLVNGKQARN
jgi:hypothetical protein